MRYTTIQLAIALSLMAKVALAGSEDRKSPYFIDGIHCEGLERPWNEDALKKNYPDDDMAAVAIQTLQQDRCEALFKNYGVEKFQWVTPADLEKLSFTLKRSNKFRAAEIRIEKSELQNHVHLIGRLTPYETRNHYSLELSNSLEKGGAAGDRNTTAVAGAVAFLQRGPSNPAPFVLSLGATNSTAEAPLASDDLRRHDKEVTMTDNEKLAQNRPSGSSYNVDLRMNFPAVTGFHDLFLFMDFAATGSRLSGDEARTSAPRYELGVQMQNDPLVQNFTQLSIFYTTYAATGSEIFSETSDKTHNSPEKSLAFAGFSQNYASQAIEGHLRFYRALTDHMHYFADFDFRFQLGEWGGIAHRFGVDSSYVRGAVLPEHRLGLPDHHQSRVYYQADRSVQAFGAENKLWLKLGSATYDADNQLDNPYFREDLFAQLGVKRRTDNFDLGLSLLYGDRRLY